MLTIKMTVLHMKRTVSWAHGLSNIGRQRYWRVRSCHQYMCFVDGFVELIDDDDAKYKQSCSRELNGRQGAPVHQTWRTSID